VKVLILHKWLITGGVETILANYIEVLHSIGYSVDVLITYKLDNKKYDGIQFVFPEKIFHKIYHSNNRFIGKVIKKIYKFYSKIRFYNKINRLCSHYDYIIDFSECLDSYIRNPFVRNKKIKSIRWVHNQLPDKKRYIKKYHKILSKHYRVIAICDEMKDILLGKFNVDSNRLLVLYNPINLNELKIKSINYDIKLEPYLLQVSRLIKGKGHEELISIYNILRNKGIKHKLYFIGDGENKENLIKIVRSLNLENDVFFLGELENPYPYFKNATLFLHCSESEGLPTVLLESMVFGVPVVAMDCPTGPKDILGINSEFGKLVPLHDKEQFVSETLKLLTSSNLYSYYSQKSLERIKDFSIEKITSDLRNLFENNEDE
jgi:glycosyltransferase